MERLNVYFCGRLAGALERDRDGGLGFRYDADYLETPGAVAISSTLPLSNEAYAEREISAFFSNLLPDEGVRTRVAEILRLTPEDTFGLLRVLGGDCAGAISFYEDGKSPQTTERAEYRRLSRDEALEVLRNLPSRPLGIDGDFRGISGAGAQDKLIACLKGDEIMLPLNGTPSTHIIKPGIARFPESVFNEWFCMRLSKACGHDTADCEILMLGGEAYYATARYDREETEGGLVRRLHQEDFCQLLRCRPEVKYQDQGGPAITECVELLKRLRMPGADVLSFVDRVVFNFIIGNGDAHGKNFSVVYRGRQPRLAPAYDLLSTAVYPAIGRKMAMKFDGYFDFRWVTAGKIVRTFERAGIGERVVREAIARQAHLVEAALPELTEACNEAYPSSVYEEIAAGATRRIGQIV